MVSSGPGQGLHRRAIKGLRAAGHENWPGLDPQTTCGRATDDGSRKGQEAALRAVAVNCGRAALKANPVTGRWPAPMGLNFSAVTPRCGAATSRSGAANSVRISQGS
jgi:hypothetical protein